MSDESNGERPKLRMLEAIPLSDGQSGLFALRDPAGLSESVMTISGPALFILSRMDGSRTLGQVGDDFQAQFGQEVERDTLATLVSNLREARFVDDDDFAEFVRGMERDYAEAAVRPAVYAGSLGDADDVRRFMDEMLPPESGATNGGGRVVGLIAPHLDYPRGGPCYAEAYGSLRGRAVPRRCVILGTNHFGRSTSVTATGKAFETPLGVTRVDLDFLERVEKGCGVDLREHEFDHKREHSIELQVMCLQHLFGADAFEIVPFLCPDPSGPTGTRPYDGGGVDLADFVRVLADALHADAEDTLLVAGADLSHVGREFGDDHAIDASFLETVATRDRATLALLESGHPEAFVDAVGAEGNPTRVCSAGCMYVISGALRDARPRMLRYHQAFNEEQQICVSCTAMTYLR